LAYAEGSKTYVDSAVRILGTLYVAEGAPVESITAIEIVACVRPA
jgi:hypothetical protein